MIDDENDLELGFASKLFEAINFLIDADDYRALKAEILYLVDRFKTRPLEYAGNFAHLNTLIRIGVQDKKKLESHFCMVDNIRRGDPEERRRDYQRTLMQQRRSRLYKALTLHESTNGIRFSAHEREAFYRNAQARWRRERDEFVASSVDQSWAGRNKAAQIYWNLLDEILDMKLARREDR